MSNPNHPLNIDRFWKKVKKTYPDRCWFWTGAKSMEGYGRIYLRGYIVLAHRMSYEINNGNIPDGMFVLHSCKMKNCVNPAHLYLGIRSREENETVRQQQQVMKQTSMQREQREQTFLNNINEFNKENGD